MTRDREHQRPRVTEIRRLSAHATRVRLMALAQNETTERGFVRDKDTGALVVTTETAGAKRDDGFLRDPDGRLVVASV